VRHVTPGWRSHGTISGKEREKTRNALCFDYRSTIEKHRPRTAAPGNIKAEARTINGVHHTLSVWADEAAMRAYLRSGAHLQAIKTFRAIATGRTFGFVTETPPEWHEVHDLWRAQAREY
jgi:quinol monooxygenase YgiN